MDHHFIRDISANDALPLEYKLQYGHTLRNADISDFINNTAVFSLHCTEESGLEEELAGLVGVDGIARAARAHRIAASVAPRAIGLNGPRTS